MDQLVFSAADHSYTLAGKRLPSVTQVIAPLVDYSMAAPEILEAARRFGQHVHQATHLYDTGELDWSTLDPALVPFVQGWQAFIEESGAVVVASEQPLVHRELGYAGTPDRILLLRDKVTVPDLKATAVLPRSVGPQTAAYARAYQSMHGLPREPERLCVHLSGNGRYSLHRRRDPSDWSMFLSCLNIYRWNHAS